MKFAERILFYPAALAATVFVVKLVYDQPTPLTFTALGALGVFWALVTFKMMFRAVKMVFWTVLILGAGIAIYFRGL